MGIRPGLQRNHQNLDMITLGIDLSSQDRDTAACVIRWNEGEAKVEDPRTRCSDGRLDALVERSDAIGIDAPFGWPTPFLEATRGWIHRTWTRELRDSLRFRETDRAVHRMTKRWPLSVSSDLVALPAMRAMSLLARHGARDKSGGDHGFYEVYPAGSLRSWGLYRSGYKREQATRLEILGAIRKRFPTLKVSDGYAETDHNLDSLVASLTAYAAAKGQTHPPQAQQRAVARVEGWIHLPKC